LGVELQLFVHNKSLTLKTKEGSTTMLPQRLLILLICFAASSHSFSQQLSDDMFKKYTTAEGLSGNKVNVVLQDSTGYLWIATTSGLTRYNGAQFVQYHSEEDSLSLTSEDLAGMSWINDHQLAVYAVGLHIIDTRKGTRHNLYIPYHNRQLQYKFNMIAEVKGDQEGNIYVLSRSGFYHFDKDYRMVSRFDYYKESEVGTEHFFFGRDLMVLDDNRILIVAIDGLYLYDKQKRTVNRLKAADCPLLAEFLDYPGKSLTSHRFLQVKDGSLFILKLFSDTLVHVDINKNRKTISRLPIPRLFDEFHYRTSLVGVNDTSLYITGHHSGFYRMTFNPVSGKVVLYPEKYFPTYLCNTIFSDREQNLWVGTNRGLFKLGGRLSAIKISNIPQFIIDSFPDIRIDDVVVSGNKLYAGSRGGGGLLVFDKSSMRFENSVIPKSSNIAGGQIYGMISCDPSTIMLGLDGPLVVYDPVKKIQKKLLPPQWNEHGDWTSDLYKQKNGAIWIAAYTIYRYDQALDSFQIIPTHPQLLSVPFVIDEDRDGHIWMAGHGLARFNTALNKYDLLIDSFPFTRMPDNQVNAMAIDNENTVWFNSNNNGLIGYNIDSKKFHHFSRKDGLPNDNIASLTVIGNKLWIACYSGIACMDLKTHQIVSFGKEDGFPDMPVVKGARFFYDSSKHYIYLGLSQAIVRFNPYDILKRKSHPVVFFENISFNGKKSYFLPARQMTTSWRSNELMITIGSVNFSDGYSQGYAYRVMKDELSPWQHLGNQPSFSISNLPPGTHRIQVKAYSLNNRWPAQVKEMIIVVTPPFWRTEWFFVLMAVVVMTVIYLLIRWRTWVATKKEMEKTHLQKLKADDYKNQFELEQISNYFSSSLAEKKNEDEVLWDVARNLIGRMNYVDCMIYLWNEDKTKMVQKAAFGPKGKPEFISANVFDVLPGQGIVGHVIQTRQPILIMDTRKDPRYRVDEEFRLSEVCVPIIHNGELMGIIDSEHYSPGYFKERDIKILTTIATLIGNKLTQIKSEQSLQVKQQELLSINEQLAEAKLTALQAQMNPHFVFNALNSIKRMILDADNEKASRYLSKFALMIRMTLNHSKEIFVTLEENIEYLRAYLDMEQLRFDSFTYNIYTADNIDLMSTAIPSMMIQPLVENAIWHGLMQSEGKKQITVGFTQCQQKITCTIEDNGIGIRKSEELKKSSKPPHQSVGLENLKKRIKILNEKYNIDCSLAIVDLRETNGEGSGTKAILRFNAINI
jgi:ligand-binding sensor domain-containing protein/putative methionine-R-sulfoxide reductase with GAF domain